MSEQNNLSEANETYSSFLTVLKWGTIASAAVTVLVVLIIAS